MMNNKQVELRMAVNKLWPMGFVLAAVLGILVSFAYAFGR